MKKFLIFFVLISCVISLKAQEFQKPRPSGEVIQELKDTLQSLKDLNTAQSYTIEEKTLTIEDLKSQNLDIAEKLDQSIKEEAAANQTITEQNVKLKLQRKWLIILSTILGSLVLIHFAIFFIKLKWNITLPYWLNSLI